jgi:hypothetical protein
LLSFGASAWKLAARERFIGWQEDERQRNLQLVVNNARFLILPWIQSKGLASKILSRIQRQLPNDWMARYGYRPVLLETFVETLRHRGTCYQAANWIKVGQTAGHGKKCPTSKAILPIKDIWLYPLHKNFRSEPVNFSLSPPLVGLGRRRSFGCNDISNRDKRAGYCPIFPPFLRCFSLNLPFGELRTFLSPSRPIRARE